MDYKTGLQEYLLALRARRLAPKTVTWYTWNLERFIKWLDERPATTGTIRHYLVHLEDCGLKPSSIHGAYRAMRAFFNFLREEGIVEHNPILRVAPPKRPITIVESLGEDECKKILQAAKSARDYAILAFMLDTGARASEVVGLRLIDLDIEAARAKVMGKGARERFVPLGFKTRRALLKYINRHRSGSDPHLFLTVQGKPMAYDCLHLMFRRLSKRAGVKCHPHKLRHTFAVTYLRNGGDIFTLQRILGHSSLEMVRRYANLADGDVQRVHEMASPMDRL